jgi:hypothetical protein
LSTTCPSGHRRWRYATLFTPHSGHARASLVNMDIRLRSSRAGTRAAASDCGMACRHVDASSDPPLRGHRPLMLATV